MRLSWFPFDLDCEVLRPVAFFILKVVAGLFSLTVPSRDASADEDIKAVVEEWQKEVSQNNRLSYKANIRTSTQVIYAEYEVADGTVRICGTARYIAGTSARQIESAPHSLCGRFVVFSDGKRSIRHLIDRFSFVETDDPKVPPELSHAPSDWTRFFEIGDLPPFIESTTDSRYQVKKRLDANEFSIVSQVRGATHPGTISYVFTVKPMFLLKSFEFLPNVEESKNQSIFKAKWEWEERDGIHFPSLRRDWYLPVEKPNGKFSREFTIESIGKNTKKPKDLSPSESQLPIGTLVTKIQRGSIRRTFVGGERGEAEHSLRTLAHLIRLDHQFYHDKKVRE